jgi:hypothetical protein
LNPDSQLCDAAHKLVKDVRTGYETSNVDGVMNGENDLKAYLMMMGKRQRKRKEIYSSKTYSKKDRIFL